MVTRVDIKVDDRELRSALKGIKEAAADPTPMFDAVGAALVSDTIGRFERGEGPGGEVWPQSLRAKLDDGQTLVDTSRLRDSITHDPGPRGVRYGTNVIYAGIHQFGGTIKAKGGGWLKFTLANGAFRRVREVTMPARPFLGIDDEQETIIAEEIEAFLADVAGPEATE